MLHGIVALCPRTGSLLWAKAYAPSFGLPRSAGEPAIDSHNLASLVFALQLNATAILVGADEGFSVGPAGGNTGEPALKSVDMGPGLRLIFYKDDKLPGLLLTLSLDPALGEHAQRVLVQSLYNSFAEKFGEQLRSSAGVGSGPSGPVRRLRGATELVQKSLASVSQYLLDDLLQTFSDRGAIIWGHAMQPAAGDLQELCSVSPLEVTEEHIAGSWDPVAGLHDLPSQVQALKAVPIKSAEGQRFEGAVVVEGVDRSGERRGSKRKAPEKLLSKCSKVTNYLPLRMCLC